MRTSLKLVVITLGFLGMSLQAEALTINAPLGATPAITCPSSPVCLAAYGNDTSNATILGIIAGYGATTEIYKQDVGAGSDTGAFAANYTTTYSNSAGDPSDALIHWVGGAFINTNPLYLLVKDGDQSPAWYLFKITVGGAGNWDGKADIDLQDFWPQQGAISHIAFYQGTANVPDGGSMSLLLGMGLVGIAAVRRKFGK